MRLCCHLVSILSQLLLYRHQAFWNFLSPYDLMSLFMSLDVHLGSPSVITTSGLIFSDFPLSLHDLMKPLMSLCCHPLYFHVDGENNKGHGHFQENSFIL